MTVRTMEEDPRVIRTRKLIKDAFLSLIREKYFYRITISDITERASVNRSTFYAHFCDKYELLESITTDIFLALVPKHLHSELELTADTLRNLIIAMCNFHETLSQTRKRTSSKSVVPLIETKIQMLLEQIVLEWLTNNVKVKENKNVNWLAIMISHSIYSATHHWNDNGRKTTASAFADEILPFLIAGLQTIEDKSS